MKINKHLFLATLIGSGLSLIASDNLLKNGSFEDFSIKKDRGKWKIVKLDNWEGGDAEVWNNKMGREATNGEYKIELDVGKRVVDKFSQNVNLEIGKTYKISLDAYARKKGSSKFYIELDDNKILSIEPTSNWQNYSVEFNATKTIHKISIRESSTQNDGKGAVIDNIVLQKTSTNTENSTQNIQPQPQPTPTEEKVTLDSGESAYNRVNVQNEDVRMARMIQEKALTFNLVSLKTNETIASGNWSDPSVWKNGMVPQAGARVVINPDHRVVIDKEINTPLRTILVEGELAFNPHKNTKLIVDTIVTTNNSILRIGEPREPIDGDKKAQIIISDYNNEGMITDNPDSPDYDPLRIGQGILVNGEFLAHGESKTPYIEIAGKGVSAGETIIELEDEVENWHIGDRVVILGVSENGTEAEERTIVAVDDDSITIDKPLEYNHIVPDTTIDGLELKVHIANLSRNIIIKTDPAKIALYPDKNDPKNIEHRGHVLFMHTNNVNISDIEFDDLGRTNKKYILDETTFTSEAPDATVTHIGTNQAARYPVHFHRAGFNEKLGRVRECVINQSPGWGYVNHSSNAVMEYNIAYGVYGSSFITEAGDEHGVFKGNMAIATRGVGRSDVRDWKSREKYDDWGFQGNGFWMLGFYVDVVDNIVNGSSNFAYALTKRAIDSVTGVIEDDNKEVKHYNVMIKTFVGNIAYGNSGGVIGILSGTRKRGNNLPPEMFKNTLAYANAPSTKGELFSWWYPYNITMENTTIVGDIHNPKYIGIGSQTKLRKTQLINTKVEGLRVGIVLPIYTGPNLVKDGYFNNLINMYYPHGLVNHGNLDIIEGDIKFGKLPIDQKQYKVQMAVEVSKRDPNRYKKEAKILYNIDDEPAPLRLFDYVHEVGGDVPEDAVVRDDMIDTKAQTLTQEQFEQLIKEGYKR
jgi:hypothetical protein